MENCGNRTVSRAGSYIYDGTEVHIGHAFYTSSDCDGAENWSHISATLTFETDNRMTGDAQIHSYDEDEWDETYQGTFTLTRK